MAKLHHRGTLDASQPSAPEEQLRLIAEFIASCRKPAVIDGGSAPVELQSGKYTIEVRSGRLSIEAWSDETHFCRRIVSVQPGKSGVLDCVAHHFGGRPGKLSFLDLDRPQANRRVMLGERQSFAEDFRQMLFRAFPRWEIATLTSTSDLQRSFSGLFPRARLKRGRETVAALACPSEIDEPAFLTFALIWFDYIRQSSPKETRVSLHLFLPAGAGALTAQRLKWLRIEVLKTRLFLFNEHGSAGEVDPEDLGNIETRVSAASPLPAAHENFSQAIVALRSQPEVTCQNELNGSLSVRFRGIEFVRIEGERFLLGTKGRQQITSDFAARAEAYLGQLRDLVAPHNSTHSPAGLSAPERWLESAVRANISLIDPVLLPEPLHGQVLTFAAGDRDIIDLLALSRDGRLAVLELKASTDIQLPLQALDYWMRIRWHLERHEIQRLFPGGEVSSVPPRLLLVAPALSFHSTNSIVLRYFSPEVEVERVGVNSDWKSNLRVILRLSGADDPISHGRSNGHTVTDTHPEGAEFA